MSKQSQKKANKNGGFDKAQRPKQLKALIVVAEPIKVVEESVLTGFSLIIPFRSTSKSLLGLKNIIFKFFCVHFFLFKLQLYNRRIEKRK